MLKTKIRDAWDMKDVAVKSFAPGAGGPEGIFLSIEEDGTSATAKLTEQGARDLITALEYALLHNEGEV